MAVGLTGGGTVAKEEWSRRTTNPLWGPGRNVRPSPTLEDGTGECLLSYGDSGGSGGQTQHVEDEMWFLDTGARGHFIFNLTELVGYAACNRTLRCACGATCSIVSTGFLEIHLRFGRGGGLLSAFLLKWDTYQASSTTYLCHYGCRCWQLLHRYRRRDYDKGFRTIFSEHWALEWPSWLQGRSAKRASACGSCPGECS